MHFRLFATATILAAVTAGSAHALIELPRPSPAALVSQRVGVTDVKVEYSSPRIKDRKVWGELVPYNELWRTGANAATKITFSRDVNIAGTEVKAGTYSLLTIPKEGAAWTLIINSDAGLSGTRNYDQNKDVVRTEVKTSAIPRRERMTFLFNDTTDAATELRLEWDTLAVLIPITTPIEKQANDSINQAAGDLATSARYLLDENKESARALQLAEAAAAIDASWVNLYVLARAQAANGKFPEAVASAKKSQELGAKADFFFWKDDVAKSITEWSAKAPQ